MVSSGNQEVTTTVTFDDAIDQNEQPPDENLKQLEPDRPSYAVYDDYTEFGKSGVWYHGRKTNKDGDITEIDEWICVPLHIDAGSCDQSDSNYGLLLRFKNRNCRERV